MMNLYYFGSNILVIATPITLYYGVSGLTYLWRQATPRTRRWALISLIAICLLLPLAAIFFIGLLGLFDSLLDYRKLDYKKEGTR